MILSKMPIFTSSGLASPVPHLLSTNSCPTEEEASLINVALIEARKLEENLFTKLAVTRRRTPNPVTVISQIQINFQLRKIQNYILNHLVLISSFRRLPVELLQIIFEHWQYARSARRRDSSKGVLFNENVPGPHLPWSLSHVCRPWRNIVLSSPKMWAHLPPEGAWSESKNSQRRPFNILTEVLKRSQGSPITLQLSLLSRVTPQEPAKLNSCLTLLLNHCERWQTLKIICKLDTLGELASIKGHLPSLKKLTLSFVGQGYNSNAVVDLFDAANNLENLHVHRFRGTLVLPPSVNLRTLACSTSWPGFPGNPLLQGGMKFSHLTCLILAITTPVRFPPGTTFPKLTDLKLHFYWSSPPNPFVQRSFLENAVVPSLEKLVISSSTRSRRPDLTKELQDMLHRSGRPSIYVLNLYIAHEDPGSLSSILSLTPSLKHLVTSLPHHTDIEALANVNNDLVPFLETCQFDVYTLIGEEIPLQVRLALERFGETRCDKSIAPLDPDTHRLYSQLKTFHLNFVDGSFAARHQCLFQGWEESALSRELELANARLMEIFPQIWGKVDCHLSSREMHWPKLDSAATSKEVHDILKNIYNLEVPHGSDIAMSRILVPLTSLLHCRLVCKTVRFSCIAEKIIIKWLPLMQAACLSDLRWSSFSTMLKYIVNGKVPKKLPTAKAVKHGIWCLAPFMFSLGSPPELLEAVCSPYQEP